MEQFVHLTKLSKSADEETHFQSLGDFINDRQLLKSLRKLRWNMMTNKKLSLKLQDNCGECGRMAETAESKVRLTYQKIKRLRKSRI